MGFGALGDLAQAGAAGGRGATLTAGERRHRQGAPAERRPPHLSALAGRHDELEAGGRSLGTYVRFWSPAGQSIVSGPSADPLRNWRTNSLSEENIRCASPASTIRPFHSSAMYSPIRRAEAMSCVTTM